MTSCTHSNPSDSSPDDPDDSGPDPGADPGPGPTRYEDFNYWEPFSGIDDVSAYIELLDAFPDFVFIPLVPPRRNPRTATPAPAHAHAHELPYAVRPSLMCAAIES